MQENNPKTSVKALTNNGNNVKIEVDSGSKNGGAELSVNLDNANSATPIMQAPFEFTTPNGCQVKLTFRQKSNPGVRDEIARLLLDAFEQKVRKQ